MAAAGLALAANLVPQSVVDHIERGEDSAELASLTGRTRDWETATEYIAKSPLVGWGAEADRWLFDTHVHNAYLYAAMQSGVPGALLFAGGLVWVWIGVWRVATSGIAERLGSASFAQCLGLLAFFTVRSIPEVSGAMFAVDLMVMLPAMAYITVLAGFPRHGPGPIAANGLERT